MGEQNQWPPIGYEMLPWKRDPEFLAQIPKSRRRKILPEYEAVLPLDIQNREVVVPSRLALRLEELGSMLTRLDAQIEAKSFDLPALLLRSESSSSSQIEHLTSSVRNVALAELSDKAPANAKLIAGNLYAMRKALSIEGVLAEESFVEIQSALMRGHGDGIRTEQVWIGGTPYSPHGATFVPPSYQRVPDCLADLCAFLRRDDLSPIVKAAIAHAQFETIHPFVDGNGRTGRSLLHVVLRDEGLLAHSTLPISAGLLHDIDDYMTALDRYHEGDPLAVVRCVADALELALLLGQQALRRIDEVLADWETRITERKGSAIHRLSTLLVQQPVVNTNFLAGELNITARAAANLVARAEELEILRRIGTARRGVFYQADELIEVLEDVANAKVTWRMEP